MMLKMCKEVMLAMVLALLGLTISTAEVSAEQAAAEQYRQMFRSGNFYVECQMFGTSGSHKYNSGILTYAGENGKRMQRTESAKSGMFSGMFSMSFTLPTSAFNATELNNADIEFEAMPRKSHFVMSKHSKWPDVLYQDGKYYRFTAPITESKNVTARVLSENDLDSATLDPEEEWQYIRSDLALPDELAVFYWNDPFRDNNLRLPTPRFNGSSTRTVGKKDYDCDQYINDIKSLAGTPIAQEVYNMLYDNGQLVMIQKYLLRNGKEYLARELKIKTISSTVPPTAFTIGKKIKVYAAANGDMKDLLEQKDVVEVLGGKKQ